MLPKSIKVPNSFELVKSSFVLNLLHEKCEKQTHLEISGFFEKQSESIIFRLPVHYESSCTTECRNSKYDYGLSRNLLKQFLPGVFSQDETSTQLIKRRHFETTVSPPIKAEIEKELRETSIGNDWVKRQLLIRLAKKRAKKQFDPVFISGTAKNGKKFIIENFAKVLDLPFVAFHFETLDFDTSVLNATIETTMNQWCFCTITNAHCQVFKDYALNLAISKKNGSTRWH